MHGDTLGRNMRECSRRIRTDHQNQCSFLQRPAVRRTTKVVTKHKQLKEETPERNCKNIGQSNILDKVHENDSSLLKTNQRDYTSKCMYFPAACTINLCPACRHLECKMKSDRGKGMNVDYSKPSASLMSSERQPLSIKSFSNQSPTNIITSNKICAYNAAASPPPIKRLFPNVLNTSEARHDGNHITSSFRSPTVRCSTGESFSPQQPIFFSQYPSYPKLESNNSENCLSPISKPPKVYPDNSRVLSRNYESIFDDKSEGIKGFKNRINNNSTSPTARLVNIRTSQFSNSPTPLPNTGIGNSSVQPCSGRYSTHTKQHPFCSPTCVSYSNKGRPCPPSLVCNEAEATTKWQIPYSSSLPPPVDCNRPTIAEIPGTSLLKGCREDGVHRIPPLSQRASSGLPPLPSTACQQKRQSSIPNVNVIGSRFLRVKSSTCSKAALGNMGIYGCDNMTTNAVSYPFINNALALTKIVAKLMVGFITLYIIQAIDPIFQINVVLFIVALGHSMVFITCP